MYNMCKRTKVWILLIGLACFEVAIAQEYYKATGVETEFYSSAPIEDIRALSKEGISVVDTRNGEMSFEVSIRSFEFRKAKMQEHFNENFMESDRYPAARFRGRPMERVDFSTNGEYPVTLVGVLDIHGRKKDRKIPATLRIEDEEIILKSRFEVACKDHDIEIPRILWKNIAEVVEVRVNARYTKI